MIVHELSQWEPPRWRRIARAARRVFVQAWCVVVLAFTFLYVAAVLQAVAW